MKWKASLLANLFIEGGIPAPGCFSHSRSFAVPLLTLLNYKSGGRKAARIKYTKQKFRYASGTAPFLGCHYCTLKPQLSMMEIGKGKVNTKSQIWINILSNVVLKCNLWYSRATYLLSLTCSPRVSSLGFCYITKDYGWITFQISRQGACFLSNSSRPPTLPLPSPPFPLLPLGFLSFYQFLLFKLNWPWTHNHPTCASQTQGSQAHAATPSFMFGFQFQSTMWRKTRERDLDLQKTENRCSPPVELMV